MAESLVPSSAPLRSVRPVAGARSWEEGAPVGAHVRPALLVIDDDRMLRRALVRVLRRKYDVTEVDDAESALALLDAGQRFDAILCDLNLQGMSGRHFVMALEAIHDVHASRVVVLSGSARDSLDEAFLTIVADRFIEKPAMAGQIEGVLADVVGQAARAA